jgi:hypothetical protein
MKLFHRFSCCSSRGSAAGVCILGPAVIVLLLTASLPAQAMSRTKLAQRELARIQKIYVMARTGKYTVQQVVLEIYRPIAAGCQGDYTRNLSIARDYYAAAQKAERNGKMKIAKRFYGAARLFQYLAKQDASVVNAYKKKNTGDIVKACMEILKTEGEISQIIGKPVKRNWFTPQELEKYARRLAAGAAGTGGAQRQAVR